MYAYLGKYKPHILLGGRGVRYLTLYLVEVHLGRLYTTFAGIKTCGETVNLGIEIFGKKMIERVIFATYFNVLSWCHVPYLVLCRGASR